MDDYSKVFISLNDYINGVKDLKGLDSTLHDITRYDEHDIYKRIKNEITINDDWLKFAEDHMKYVESAVYENRQFIREDGEVLPIERVKKISKNSVENLARHSDYIEKIDTDGNIIPEKLYTVNKDTDYGVYENKFLYLLLITLSEFITRFKDDVEAEMKRENGVLSFVRKNDFMKDEVSLEIKLTFREKNPIESASKLEQEKYNRMDILKDRVNSLLATPLMQVVSKEPLISSSITKTNVLTMNENFSNSLELYEYLLNYDKEAFHMEKHEEAISFKNEFAYPVLALELLAEGYKESLMDSFKKDQFDDESEKRSREIEILNERINAAKNKNEGDLASYVVILEDKLKLLNEQNGEIKVLRGEITELEGIRCKLEEENEELRNSLEDLNNQLKSITEEMKKVMDEKGSVEEKYQKKLALKDEEISGLRNDIASFKKQYADLEYEKNEAMNREASLKEQVRILEGERDVLKEAYEKRLSDKDHEYESSMEEYRTLKARFQGIEAEAGNLLASKADTNEEAFNELEREYNSFTKYYEAVWKRCKKEILKEIKRKKG